MAILARRGVSPAAKKAGFFGKKKPGYIKAEDGSYVPKSFYDNKKGSIMERVRKATQSPNFRMGTATPIGSHKSGGVLYDDGKVRNTNRSSHRKAVGTHKTGLPILNIFKKKKK